MSEKEKQTHEKDSEMKALCREIGNAFCDSIKESHCVIKYNVFKEFSTRKAITFSLLSIIKKISNLSGTLQRLFWARVCDGRHNILHRRILNLNRELAEHNAVIDRLNIYRAELEGSIRGLEDRLDYTQSALRAARRVILELQSINKEEDK